jgi:hypothetical protein
MNGYLMVMDPLNGNKMHHINKVSIGILLVKKSNTNNVVEMMPA